MAAAVGSISPAAILGTVATARLLSPRSTASFKTPSPLTRSLPSLRPIRPPGPKFQVRAARTESGNVSLGFRAPYFEVFSITVLFYFIFSSLKEWPLYHVFFVFFMFFFYVVLWAASRAVDGEGLEIGRLRVLSCLVGEYQFARLCIIFISDIFFLLFFLHCFNSDSVIDLSPKLSAGFSRCIFSFFFNYENYVGVPRIVSWKWWNQLFIKHAYGNTWLDKVRIWNHTCKWKRDAYCWNMAVDEAGIEHQRPSRWNKTPFHILKQSFSFLDFYFRGCLVRDQNQNVNGLERESEWL